MEWALEAYTVPLAGVGLDKLRRCLSVPQQVASSPEPTLESAAKAPAWLLRPYVHRAYLVGGTPAEAAWQTLFGWNNETLNAHTMIWYAWLATWLYLGIRDQLSADASVPFTLLWASCVAHAPFSVGLHCTIGVSAEQRSVWRTLDIGMIFTASFALAAAMGWYVLPGGAAYAAFLAAALGSYAAVVWQTMVARRMRDIPKPEVARYVACSVLTYALPMLAAAAREVAELGRPGPISRSVLYVGTALYVGGEVYARHLPERWAPGRFDTLCNSHQLMHLCAIAGHYLKWRLLCQLAARAGEPTLGWAAA